MCHSLDSCVEDNWSAPLASVMSPDKKWRERERKYEMIKRIQTCHEHYSWFDCPHHLLYEES